jgi:parallel beta-helix repeat protein
MKITRAFSLALGFIVFGGVSSIFGQGALTPPGSPAPTMKTLDQIEARTPITSLPFVIGSPGSYYFTGNLVGTAGTNGITVLTDGVSIDLNGFVLAGKPGSSNGVFAAAGVRTLSVRNGTVKSWGRAGIEAINANNCQFADLRVDSNGGPGLDSGNGSIITKCNAISNGGTGISGGNGSTMKECTAQSNAGAGLNGFFGSTIIGCAAQSNTGVGISASSGNTIKDCSVQSNGGGGISTAGNCTINGCSVYSNTGIGISTGYSLVEGCTVNSNTGEGIYLSTSGTLLHNSVYSNGGFVSSNSNIHVIGSYNRLEGNHSNNGYSGIRVDSAGNVIIRNSAGGNNTNFFISTGNLAGPQLGSAGVSSNTNPDSNFTY